MQLLSNNLLMNGFNRAHGCTWTFILILRQTQISMINNREHTEISQISNVRYLSNYTEISHWYSLILKNSIKDNEKTNLLETSPCSQQWSLPHIFVIAHLVLWEKSHIIHINMILFLIQNLTEALIIKGFQNKH